MSTVLPKPSEPRNLGASTRPILRPANYPDSDALARERAAARSTESQVDVLFVNPPTPDGAIWIRSQHRVGRRSRENMIWPQVSLAQLAAMLHPTYSVHVIDAVAERSTGQAFERLRPRAAAAVLRDARHRRDAGRTISTAPSSPRPSAR